MRILQLIQSLRRGGAERILLDLAAGMREAGHEPLTACLVPGNDFSESRYLGIGTEILLEGEPLRWPLYVPSAASRLAAMVRGRRPDALLVHTPNAAIVAGWARLPVPVIEVVHCRWNLFPSGRLRSLVRRTEARAAFARNGRRAIVVASPLLPDTAAYLGCTRDRVRCIPNGVDLEAFAFAGKRPSADPKIVVVGSLTGIKRPGFAVAAFHALHGRIPGATLELVGEGPLRGELERQVAELGLGDRVRLAGASGDVREALRRADCCWQCSCEESFGLAMVEAMACGVPVVAVDSPGIRETVGDGEGGVLTPPGDPGALAEATIRLFGDPAGYGRIARAARARAEARYDARRMVARYLNAISDAVSGRW